MSTSTNNWSNPSSSLSLCLHQKLYFQYIRFHGIFKFFIPFHGPEPILLPQPSSFSPHLDKARVPVRATSTMLMVWSILIISLIFSGSSQI